MRGETSCKQVNKSRSRSHNGKMKRFAIIFGFTHIPLRPKLLTFLCVMVTPPNQTKVAATLLKNCTFATQTHTKAKRLHFIPVQTSTEVFCVDNVNRSWDKMPSLFWEHRGFTVNNGWLGLSTLSTEHTHTEKWAVPVPLGDYQGQRRIISVAQGRLSKRRHKHNHNSSKCRHFYCSGSWGPRASVCGVGVGGCQRACVFPGHHALLVASGSRSGVSCRLRWGSVAVGGLSTLWEARATDQLLIDSSLSADTFPRLHWD